MKKRILGKTDIHASVVGFGGIPIQGLTFLQAERVLLHAVENGINFFDSARGYTDSEDKIGRAFSKKRDSIYLATKAMSRDGGGMERELEASLRNLRTGMIDLYQFHGVGNMEQLGRILAPGGAMEILTKARSAGKVRWIGITGHSRSLLLEAARTGLFDTIQMPLNAIETEWEEEVIPTIHEAGIGTLGMKPLAGGALGNAASAIRFTLTRGIDISIPGMNAVEQIDENIKAGDLEPPSPEELEMLRKEKEGWGELFCRRCGYCMPCPTGLNIPFLLLLEGYYNRYELKDWAISRLKTQKMKYNDCTACGECLEKCPYHLPIPDLMKRAERLLL